MHPLLIAALAYFFLKDPSARAVPPGAGTPAPAPFVPTTASIATGNAPLLQSTNAPPLRVTVSVYRQPVYPVDPLLGTAVNPVNTSIADRFTPADPVEFEDGGRAPYRTEVNWL